MLLDDGSVVMVVVVELFFFLPDSRSLLMSTKGIEPVSDSVVNVVVAVVSVAAVIMVFEVDGEVRVVVVVEGFKVVADGKTELGELDGS